MAYYNRNLSKYRRRRKPYQKKNFPNKLRARARKNLITTIKDVINHDAEKKIFAKGFNNESANASDLGGANLTDISTGNTSFNRIGNEIVGSRFEVNLNLTNGTNNDLFVRVALLEEAGRGGTTTIDKNTGIYQSPLGVVTNWNTAEGVVASGPVMWPFDTQGSVITLKDKVFKLPKNNGGSSSTTRSFRWNVPWEKKIRFVNESNEGEYNQNKRVTMLFTAWSPSGGTQSTYTYNIDGYTRFYYKDM